MRLKITRNTGFYAMGSALKISKNGEELGYINEKQTREFDIAEQEYDLQASFYFVKSPIYHVDTRKSSLNLVILMDEKPVSMYLALFIVSAMIPMLFRSIIVSLFIIILYFFFFFKNLKNMYTIKEIEEN